MVDFRVAGVFLLHFLVVFLFLLAILLIQVLQALPSLMLFHHLVLLELIMAVLVKVLQVISRLDVKTKRWEVEFTS